MTISDPIPDGARRRPFSRLPWIALAGGVVLILIVMLLGAVLGGGRGSPLDEAIMTAMRVPGHPGVPVGPYWLRRAMLDVTVMGGGRMLTLFVILAAGLMIARGDVRAAALTVAATASGGLAVDMLKGWFDRPRPALIDHFVLVRSASYPSAHAANSALVFLTIALLAARTGGTCAERRYTMAAALLLTLMIGASRVYLGVHWPSDVVAGWLFGAGWALLWCAVAQMPCAARKSSARPKRPSR